MIPRRAGLRIGEQYHNTAGGNRSRRENAGAPVLERGAPASGFDQFTVSGNMRCTPWSFF